MKFLCLASGSSGNCYFLHENNTNILVDAGISFKQIDRRLDSRGFDVEDVSALLISHEHIDHIRSADLLYRKLNATICANKKTIGPYNLDGRYDNLKLFARNHSFEIGDFGVRPIETSHDSAEPTGFVFQCDGKKIGIITDTGIVTDDIKKSIRDVDCLVIESNHDKHMLLNGRYPEYLKKRIDGKLGHLSNEDAGVLVLENASDRLKNIFLAHLSENNNTPELALRTMQSILKQRKDLKHVKVHLTDRYRATEMLQI